MKEWDVMNRINKNEGITLPNKYINLSLVTISLKHVKNNITLTIISEEQKPNNTDSNVTGLLLGKYKITVTPSWLNSGFITDIIKKVGKI